MSQDPAPSAPVSRAEKRATRDAVRAAQFKRGTKRKADGDDEAEAPKPEVEKKNELEQDFIALPAVNEVHEEAETGQSTRKARRAARDAERAEKFRVGKKRKLEGDGGIESVEGDTRVEGEDLKQDSAVQDSDVKPTAPKKRKTQPQEQTRKPATEPDEKPAGKQRFIVFLGNLPYTTTDASLLTHFASLQPFTLRHRTDPKTKKSKGFAFLEFEAYDRMKTCLKIYHHSYFDPEAPEKSRLAGADGEVEVPQQGLGRGKGAKKEKGRRINVELTAGGGGAKGERKEKIRVKNVRLEEQRQRRAELERKEKGKKEGNRIGDAAKRKGRRDAAEGEEEIGKAGAEGMHPARLAMMNR